MTAFSLEGRAIRKVRQSVTRLERAGYVRRVHGETDPCELMDRVAPGLKVALTPDRRAGVFGAVIEGGAIAVGDTVTVE